MEHVIRGNCLVTEQFEVEFEFPISIAIYTSNIYVVLLAAPRMSAVVDNLYGVDHKGRIIWKVQSVQSAFKLINSTPYIALKAINEKVVSVTNFYGMRYYVDVVDGKLIEKENIRW